MKSEITVLIERELKLSQKIIIWHFISDLKSISIQKISQT